MNDLFCRPVHRFSYDGNSHVIIIVIHVINRQLIYHRAVWEIEGSDNLFSIFFPACSSEGVVRLEYEQVIMACVITRFETKEMGRVNALIPGKAGVVATQLYPTSVTPVEVGFLAGVEHDESIFCGGGRLHRHSLARRKLGHEDTLI